MTGLRSSALKGPSSRETPRIAFEALAPDVHPPVRSTEHSAGYDLRAHLTHGPVRVYRQDLDRIVDELPTAEAERGEGASEPFVELQPGGRALIPTGFRARLPEGCEGQIRVRSSVAWKKGLQIPNAPGTVDADYPDEWFVLIQNASARPQRIAHRERIAQLVLNRYEVLEWEEGAVGVSTDRVGGLGSTGS